ncbi:uncharacterized protein ISCGN_018319 [Ixodes scapularis]
MQGKITTDLAASRIISHSSEHTHAGDPTEINLLKTRDMMKGKAAGSRETPHQILLHAASTVSEDTGLQSRYNMEEDFAVQMRMFPALAFLLVGEIPEAFQDPLEVIAA